MLDSKDYSMIDTWAFGHTHFNNDQLVGKSRVVSNQRGYHFEVDKNFKTNKVLVVPYSKDKHFVPLSKWKWT